MIRPSLSLRLAQVNPPTDFYDHFASKWESLFADLKQDSIHLAENLLIPLCERFDCRTIIDVGCGTGYDLKALRQVWQAQSHSRELVLSGFDVSEEMVKQARSDSTEIPFAGGNQWDIASEDFPSVFSGPEGRALGSNEKFDAALCLGNAICHISPGNLHLAFRNMASMLKDGGILVIEFRDGDRLREYIRASPHRHGDADGNNVISAYEHRSLTHDEQGHLLDSFLRYLWLNEELFTINAYFVEIPDVSGYHEENFTTNSVVTCVRSMNVAYVSPDLVTTELAAAGFDVRQVSDYTSVLRFGTILVAKKKV